MPDAVDRAGKDVGKWVREDRAGRDADRWVKVDKGALDVGK